VAARRLHRFRARRGGDHLKSGIAQAGGQQLEDVRLILHNEQPGIVPLPPVARRHGHVTILGGLPEDFLNVHWV
jgi:hypothetical protein